MLNLAQSRGVAVLSAAPYAGGALASGSSEYPRYAYWEASNAALDPISRVEAVCARRGAPPWRCGAAVFHA
jgi:D-threo-aldose 1-dehydrogenase